MHGTHRGNLDTVQINLGSPLKIMAVVHILRGGHIILRGLSATTSSESNITINHITNFTDYILLFLSILYKDTEVTSFSEIILEYSYLIATSTKKPTNPLRLVGFRYYAVLIN
jgi:hypothetical protein